MNEERDMERKMLETELQDEDKQSNETKNGNIIIEELHNSENEDKPEGDDNSRTNKSNNVEDKKKTEKEREELEREKKEEQEVALLKAAIAEQAREDERPQSANFTLRKILGGDILWSRLFRNNIKLMILIAGIIIVYITNRYSVQKDLIEIDKLNQELEDAKYRALSSNSQLTEKTRESHVLELLKNQKDSVLKISDRPPYIINVPKK